MRKHEAECEWMPDVDNGDGSHTSCICICDQVRAAYRRGFNDHAFTLAHWDATHGGTVRREVRVYGTPAPQGSKRHVGRGVMVESSRAVKPWREAVVGACERAGIASTHLDVAVDVRITFWLVRPASHRTPKGALRANAPLAPGRTPDLDKLVRSTLDALTQADVLADDARVVTLHARKRYADDTSPGALIHVTTHAPEQEN